MPGIVWLASYPKSGNTWVRAFLANLMADRAEPVPINDLPNYCLGDNFLLHYEQYTGKKADDLTPEDCVRLRPKVHEWFAHSRPDNALVKTHNAVLKIDGQPLITPSATAGAIYIVRNPMDVAVSFANHYQMSYQRAVESLCQEAELPAAQGQLKQYLGSWSTHYLSWTTAPGLPLHLMRYEDIQKGPFKAFSALMAFLKLPEDRRHLRKAIRFSSFQELAGQEQRERFIESRTDGKSRFFRAGKTGAWRRFLTDPQVERIIASQGEVMTSLGYLTKAGKLTI